MKLLQKIFSENISSRIARKGLGPLIPSTANSFLSGTCTECGQSVSDFTIFGNALVLNENGIFKIKCSDCRFGSELQIRKPQVLRGTINKNYILIDLNDRIESKSTSWIEVMIAWYVNYGILQNEKRYTEAYSIKFNDTAKDHLLSEDVLYLAFEHKPPIQSVFGKIEMLKSCGECGAFWSNNYKKDKIPDLIKAGKCLYCGIPHQFQWNMRTTFDDELKKLKKYNN